MTSLQGLHDFLNILATCQGCNLLYWNELEGLKEKDMPANEMEDVQQIRSDLKLDTFHNDTAYMALLIQMCVYIVLCILSGALLHRTFRK
jgi:hypothetical protein